MKNIFILIAFLISISLWSQTPGRHSGGVIIGDPSGTGADPVGVKAGYIYWNDTNKKFRKYDGTTWTDLTIATTPNLQQVTDIDSETTNSISINGTLTPNININNTSTSRTGALHSDSVIFTRDGFDITIQSPSLTGNHTVLFQDGPGTVAYLSDAIGEVNVVETIVNPIDVYYGTRIQPKGTTDGYYVNATENKGTGYLVKSNNNTDNGHYAGFTVEGYGATPLGNLLNLSIYGQNYFAPYLQDNAALYFTNDLKIIGAKNTSDISFRLGNSGSPDVLESVSDEVLTLASNRTITAPELTNALISTGGNQSLVTKNYVDTNFASAPLDAAYGVSWDGDTTNSASRNAIYDKIEAVILSGGGESTTVSDTSEIDLTLTGNDITGIIVASSIDEGKLDFSVNASLDKADTALQVEVDGSITNEIQTSVEVAHTPSGNLSANDVGAALNELQTDIDSRSFNNLFEKELIDSENNINVGFNLEPTTVVFFNGALVPNTKWSGEGTSILNLSMNTKVYDVLTVKK